MLSYAVGFDPHRTVKEREQYKYVRLKEAIKLGYVITAQEKGLFGQKTGMELRKA